MPRKSYALVPVAVFLVAVWMVRLPYYSEGPGPAKDVEPLIRIDGHQEFASAGHFVLTSVSFHTLNAFQAVSAWLDPNLSIVSEDLLLFPGETPQQADVRAISEMDQSKIDATVVALSRVTRYPRDHKSGVLVESVYGPNCPATNKLFPGDRIDSVNGSTVDSVEDFSQTIDSIPTDRPVRLHGSAGGEPFTVSLVRRPCAGSDRPLIGISTVATFPFGVSISSGEIGGPSAGLMWALGLYDLLTPGDLTDGKTIAGTGTIGPDGTVGPIGGVEDKIAAARSSGAEAFLVPEGNLAAARKVAGDLPLLAVKTFRDALAALRRGA